MSTRTVAVAIAFVVLATTVPAFAAGPREGKEPRVVKMLKKAVKSLSDTLTIPLPASAPKP